VIDKPVFSVHTLNTVKLVYDPAKSERNAQERGLSFERAHDFDFETAKFWEDSREGKKHGFAQKRD
jgi:uncharacterized DUF497 family protein